MRSNGSPASTSRWSSRGAGRADPARIVARSDHTRAMLGWRPAHDDLATVMRDALAWEVPSRHAGEGGQSRAA
jgi:UDP-glucose 4-epimerase